MDTLDYYKILSLPFKFTPNKLFGKFLTASRNAIVKQDQVEFVNCRKGFEVLRSYRCKQSYDRIYRLKVLKEELHFPEVRLQQMLDEVRAIENKAEALAIEDLKGIKKSSDFYYDWFLDLILFDLRFRFGRPYSGLLTAFLSLVLLLKGPEISFILGGGTIFLFGVFLVLNNYNRFISRD